jgi:hypothetical protein
VEHQQVEQELGRSRFAIVHPSDPFAAGQPGRFEDIF